MNEYLYKDILWYNHILEEIRREFRNRLEFKKKEPKLSERLKICLIQIEELNRTKIFSKCTDRELLIKKLVQTRNYHTHGDSKDKYPEMITDVHEMYETK